MRLRPCIDIHNGQVKQIVGGSLRDAETAQNSGDGEKQTGDGAARTSGGDSAKPASGAGASCAATPSEAGSSGLRENFVSARGADYYAALYRERGLSGGHIILLNSAQKEPEAYAADWEQALRALRAYPGGMQVGGGVTPENAELFLDAGASHVIVTSYVFRDGRIDWERLARLERAVGRERLVLDLSCKRKRCGREGAEAMAERARYAAAAETTAWPNGLLMAETAETATWLNGQLAAAESPYVVVTDRWQRETEVALCAATLDELASHCDEFLIHAADVEGRQAGVEAGVVRILGAWLAERGVQAEPPVRSAGGQTTDAAGNRTGSAVCQSAVKRMMVPDRGRTAQAGEILARATYAGGVHSLGDLEQIRALSDGLLDVTVGSALSLFGGPLSLDELERACRGGVIDGKESICLGML